MQHLSPLELQCNQRKGNDNGKNTKSTDHLNKPRRSRTIAAPIASQHVQDQPEDLVIPQEMENIIATISVE